MEIVFNKKGVPCYECLIRGKLIKASPEEKVRQEFIEKLIREKKIPKENISVEMRLSKYGIVIKEKKSKRADIVIHDDDDYVYAVIECKNERVPLTYKTIEQVEEYANELKATVYGTTNGVMTNWFLQEEEGAVLVEDLPVYSNLFLEGAFTAVKAYSPSSILDDFSDFYPYQLISLGKNLLNLLEDTSVNNAIPFIQVCNNYAVAKDAGILLGSYGNPAGVDWIGRYRYLWLEDMQNRRIKIGFTLHKKRDYISYFNVAVHIDDKEQHSLQLMFRDWVYSNGSKFGFWHDGTITTGKGRARKQDMLDLVQERYPELMKNGYVFLGELDNSKQFTFANPDVMDFIKNLVKYVLCRQEFRGYL